MKILLLYWLLFTISVINIHLRLIKSKKSPDKFFWFIVRLVFGTCFALTELSLKTKYLGVAILMYWVSNWFLHDTLIALGLRRKPWYLNSNGDLDKLQPMSGWVYIWAIKLIACFTLIGMYLFHE
jgi:hypothetical protein